MISATACLRTELSSVTVSINEQHHCTPSVYKSRPKWVLLIKSVNNPAKLSTFLACNFFDIFYFAIIVDTDNVFQ